MSVILCLMGPTASGKTPLAVELVQRLPLAIVSVDSAMVYKGMNIGTAKPDANTLRIAPHRLIDIVDPKEIYSAGQFRKQALQEIAAISAQGKIPLLVGGTMLYFRVLHQGIAQLPTADAALRAELQARAQKEGWPSLHALLSELDPMAALRIHPNDSQRIQRALEVSMLTGKTMSAWQHEATEPLSDYQVHHLALMPSDRSHLHARIAERFAEMLKLGFVDEARALFDRDDLSADLPSIRSVGYRQAWAYFQNELSYDEMREQTIAATRQLAKRQMTWLRSWPGVMNFESETHDLIKQVRGRIQEVCRL